MIVKVRVLTPKDGAGKSTQFDYEVDDTTYISTYHSYPILMDYSRV